MFLFLLLLTIGFIYELFLGAIDIYFYVTSNNRFSKFKLMYLFVFLFTFINRFGYGFIIKESLLSIFVKESNLLQILYILKKNEISALSSLLDIAVVDNLKLKLEGRFILNYVFLNYLNAFRVVIKLLNDGRAPVRSLSSLYKSSD